MKERTIAIIYDFAESKHPLSLEDLSSKFQVSIRTIRNEIKEINEYLAVRCLPRIENVRKKGMILPLTSETRKYLDDLLKEIRKDIFLIPEERWFDLILDIALNNQPTYLFEKEVNYEVSKSTIDDDIRRVRNMLSKYQVGVESIAKIGLVLTGKERNIRTMIFDIVNRFSGTDYYFSQDIEETIFEKIFYSYCSKTMLRKIDQLYEREVSQKPEILYRKHLIAYTAIWVLRNQMGHSIAQSNKESLLTGNSCTNQFIHKVIQVFDIHPSSDEIKFLDFTLETLSSKNMNNSLDWAQAQLLTISLIQHVEKQTKIPFTRREGILYEGLYKHITGLLARMRGDVQVINPLKNNIKQNYSELYRAVQLFSTQFEEIARRRIKDDEIAFLTIYFSTSESKINQDIYYYYKTAVICNHGMATAGLLAENLKELFNLEVVAVLSTRELEILDKIEVDIIFTTVTLEYKGKPTLKLDPIIRQNDKNRIKDFLEHHQNLRRIVTKAPDATNFFLSILNLIESSGGELRPEIYTKVERIFEENNQVINKEEIQPMLQDILKESQIVLNMKANTWEEVIQNVAEPLVEEGVIKPSYIDAMIQSVEKYGPYIVIGNHLALAHARPEDGVNELGISVATLNPGIDFGNADNDPVQLIFCLAAVDSYSHLNVMKNLVNLINDEEKIGLLVQEKDIQKFQEILYS